MAADELILCIDIGGDSIKATEFLSTSEGLVLDKFAYQEYMNDADDDASFVQAMLPALQEVITSNGFESKSVYLSISGQNALIPFIKVPALNSDPQKIREMITFEASSRIPYPLNEVVWDYQLIDNPESDGSELDVMLVSVKNDDVVAITEAVEALGCKVKAVEVAPTALYNSARANGIGDNQCEMILNIGGKSSTLVFLDGPRFFVRTIPVAGNTITQQIAKEFNMSFVEADEIKRRHGFVALGGAYDAPESDMAATVSKIVRNVMTRLHGEINRSINVYRATQHGRKPEKLYLAGGSSIMAFTPRFFVEKLRVPVEYFNPFQVTTIGENVDQQTLTELAHLYGETIGLALRHIRTTPIEISLIPEHVKKQNLLRMKVPYFYASCVALLAYLGFAYYALDNQSSQIGKNADLMQDKLAAIESTQSDVESAKSKLAASEAEYKKAVSGMEERNKVGELLSQIQDCLPPYVWCTSVSLDTVPSIAGDSGKQNSRASDSRSSSRRRSGRNSKSSAADGQWLNMTGYIVASNDMNVSGSMAEDICGQLRSNVQKTGLVSEGVGEDEYKQSLVSVPGGGENVKVFMLSFKRKVDKNAEK